MIVIDKASCPVHAPNGDVAWKKFIPKYPVIKANGMKNVVIKVKVFITSLIRLLTTER